MNEHTLIQETINKAIDKGFKHSVGTALGSYRLCYINRNWDAVTNNGNDRFSQRTWAMTGQEIREIYQKAVFFLRKIASSSV